MLALIVAACAALSQSERIPGSGGLGFLSDGVTYASIVRDPSFPLTDKYYLHRALPSWVVHIGLRVVGQPFTNASIVSGFLALNSVLLVAAVALWRPISDRLDLQLPARWLGFVALFVNVALLKIPFYYPVLTDTAAFTLGVVAVWASLSRRRWVLALTILASSFTWPLGPFLFGPLLLWPPGSVEPPPTRGKTFLVTATAAMPAALFLAWFVWIYVVRGQTVRASQFAVPAIPGIVWLGIAGAVAYIFFSVRALLAGITLQYIGTVLRRTDVIGLALAVAAVLPAELLVAAFADDRATFDSRQFIGNVILFSSTRPFLFAITNIVVFGPALLFFLQRRIRSEVVSATRDLGPGWVVLLVATIGLSLNSESRQSILQFPAVVCVLAVAANRAGTRAASVWPVAVLALAMSKVWLTMNLEPARMIDTNDPLMAHYYGRYFMNMGPWMSNRFYIINAVIVTVAAGVLAITRSRSELRSANSLSSVASRVSSSRSS